MQLADWKADSAGMPGRWLRAAPRGKAAAALAMPLALLLAALLYIYWLVSDVQYAGQMAMQASEARGELTQLHSSLLDAETAAIGYLATGQAGYLPRLESARSA